MTEPMDIGRRLCRDCRAVPPPPGMYRCGRCLLKRLELLSKKDRT